MSFDLTLPLLLALALGLATCGDAAAQTIPAPDVPQPPVTDAPVGRQGPAPSSPGAPAPDELARPAPDEAAPRDSLAEAARNAARASEAARLARPVVYATGYGLTVTLPPGWEGPVTAAEDAFPGYALYTFENARLDRAVPGARLRIERIGTLDPVAAERWRRGQSSYGLHGLRPVALADVGALPAGTQTALTLAGENVRGIAAYARRGGAYWAIQATVPAAIHAAAPDIAAELVRGVVLPAELVGAPR